MLKSLKKLWQDEEGASAVEYGLVVAGIAAVIIVVVFLIGGKLNNTLSGVANALPATN
jgi:pilus assembly protein Flp/PilA